jgi:hypothetical protein
MLKRWEMSHGRSKLYLLQEIDMRWLAMLRIVVVLAVVGCASERPVLYPNEQLKQVGVEAANRDIGDCLRQAQSHVPSSARAGKASPSAVQAGTGTVIGGVGSTVGGATSGLVRGVFSNPEPSPSQKNFVNRCLREKGYSPVRWQ